MPPPDGYAALLPDGERNAAGDSASRRETKNQTSFVSTKTISVLNVKYKYIIRKNPEMIKDMSNREIIFAYGANLNEKSRKIIKKIIQQS